MTRDEYYTALDISMSLSHFQHPGAKWGQRHSRYPIPENELSEKEKSTVYTSNLIGLKDEEHPLLKSGTIGSRISISTSDPNYGNRKYISVTDKDNEAWADYLGKAYAKLGTPTYQQTYEVTHDLKIMTMAEQGKKFTEMFMGENGGMDAGAFFDTVRAVGSLGQDFTPELMHNPAEMASYNVAMETATGEQFINKVLSEGYGGLVDVHGMNVADIPIIVLDPDKNLKKIATPTITTQWVDHEKEDKHDTR